MPFTAPQQYTMKGGLGPYVDPPLEALRLARKFLRLLPVGALALITGSLRAGSGDFRLAAGPCSSGSREVRAPSPRRRFGRLGRGYSAIFAQHDARHGAT